MGRTDWRKRCERHRTRLLRQKPAVSRLLFQGAEGARSRCASWTLAWLTAFICATWAAGALYFDFPKASAFVAILFVIALLAIIIFVRGKLLKLAIVFGAFAAVVSWWLTVKPSNDREWQPDV